MDMKCSKRGRKRVLCSWEYNYNCDLKRSSAIRAILFLWNSFTSFTEKKIIINRIIRFPQSILIIHWKDFSPIISSNGYRKIDWKSICGHIFFECFKTLFILFYFILIWTNVLCLQENLKWKIMWYCSCCYCTVWVWSVLFLWKARFRKCHFIRNLFIYSTIYIIIFHSIPSSYKWGGKKTNRIVFLLCVIIKDGPASDILF